MSVLALATKRFERQQRFGVEKASLFPSGTGGSVVCGECVQVRRLSRSEN
jgi:hypothetical protein